MKKNIISQKKLRSLLLSVVFLAALYLTNLKNTPEKNNSRQLVTPTGTVEGIQVPTAVETPNSFNSTTVKAVKIIDGDTFEIEDGQKIRLIGVDTPERSKCYYQDAKNKLTELIDRKELRLEKDVSDKDRFGRLLRYVYSGDVFINEVLVSKGYARVSTYPPDVKYQQDFISKERSARENNMGLWSKCTAQNMDK